MTILAARHLGDPQSSFDLEHKADNEMRLIDLFSREDAKKFRQTDRKLTSTSILSSNKADVVSRDMGKCLCSAVWLY